MKICPLCHNEMKLFPGEWQPLYFCPNEACRFFTEKLTVKAISFLNEHLTRQSAIIVAQAELIGALSLSRLTWMDMYCGMGMLPENRDAMVRGTHEFEIAVNVARAKLAEVQNANPTS